MKESKFKQTEVGMIPWDWKVKTLGDIFDFSAGGDLQKDCFSEYQSGSIKYPIFSNSLEKNGLYGYTSKPRYDANSVTITGRGSLGHAEYRRQAFDAIVRLLILSPKVDVNCFFVSETINYRVPFVFESTGVPQLTAPQAAKSAIPLPPTIEEQQRIANALSDVDTLIINLEKLIAKKKNIKQGAMQQLLTGRKRLPGFGPSCHPERSTKCAVEGSSHFKMTELGPIPSDWEVKKIGDFCSIKDGTHGTYARYSKGCLLLSAKNILDNCLEITDDESFVSEKDYAEITANGYPQKNDILVSCVGSIGRCCILESNEKIAFQRSVAFIRNKCLNTRFLMYEIQSETAQKQLEESKNASTLGGVYLSALANIKVFAPSSKAEQTAIANVLSDMDSEIQTLETKLAKYRKLKTGMMQQLLTGKIRLID